MTGQRKTRVLLALPGFHRVERGAEVSLEAVARGLARRGDFEVTVVGSGRPRDGEPYRFLHAGCVRRERFERWPRVPLLRSEYAYEELTFLPGLLRQFDPAGYDVTIGCSFPFAHWALRWRRNARPGPAHVFVTQNGDWPARCNEREYRWFGCDGLVCTNPEFFERHRDRFRCALIPNGVDPGKFAPGSGDRAAFGLRADAPAAVIVSALIPSKRVVEGVAAAAQVGGLQLLVAGDGPLRARVEQLGAIAMGGRFQRRTVPRQRMGDLYRCADVLLHMSTDEPFGNIYLEASAAGLPVVAHDWRTTRWMLEDTALLVDTHDPDAVAAAVRRALTLRGNGEVARRRELVRRRFAWPIVVDQYADFLQRVARERD